MMRKTCVAAALTLGLCGMALADTPIGPGATGSGGTGANAADKNLRPGAGGDAPVVRQDGMPADQADVNVRADGAVKGPGTGDLKRDAAAPTGVGATGTPGGAGKAAGALPEEVRAAPAKQSH
jgi:hypothetical protein